MIAEREDWLLQQLRGLAAALVAAWRVDGPPPDLDEAGRAAGLDLDMAGRLPPTMLVGLLMLPEGIDAKRALQLGLALAARGHAAHARALIEAAIERQPSYDAPELQAVLEGLRGRG